MQDILLGSNNKPKDIFFEIISSLIIMATLISKWDVVPETGVSSHLADYVNRFAYSFSFGGYSDVFVFIGVLFLIKIIRNIEPKMQIFTLIVSAILAIIYICSLSFLMYSSMFLVNRDGYQMIYSILLLVGTTLIIYFVLRACAHILSKCKMIVSQQKKGDNSFVNRHLFIFSFALISICWLFWIVCTYPGNCNTDAIYQLSQYFSGDCSKWTTHHPPFSTLIMGTLVELGRKLFKSANIGFATYLILQTIVGALIISYGVLTLQQVFKIKDKILVVIVLFFAITPFWGVYAALYEKSLFYSEFALLITILLLPVVKDRSISCERMIALCVTCILTALLRNNGIYAIVPTLLILIVYLKGIDRKRIIVTLVVVLVLYNCVNNVLYPSLGIQKGSIAEALTVPFQQTAKYVRFYSYDVTEEEKAAIDAVLSYDVIGEVYDYNVSNPVKDTYKGDNSKLGAYLGVWFKMFFKHPGIYFSAFMDASYGYIAPVNQSIEATADFDYEAAGLQKFGLTHQLNAGGVELANAIRTFSLQSPLLKYLCMPGLYSWVMVLAILLLIKRKKYGALIVFVPSVMNFLVCLASPLSTSMRYSQPTVLSVPFLVGTAIYYIQRNMDEIQLEKEYE